MLIFTTLSGSRWVDCSRLFWDDLLITKIGTRTFFSWFMRISKTDNWSENDDIRVVASSKTKKYCPIYALIRFWCYRGKTITGPVFVQNPNTYELVNVRSSFYIVQKIAKSLGWSQIPRKHSPRISMLTFLAKQGYSSAQLNHHFEWAPSSAMSWHYLGQNLACTEDSPAVRIAEFSEGNH